MLPADELKRAIDIHSRSYKLLRWLASAMDAGKIPVPRTISPRHSEDITAATLDWIGPWHATLPPDMRPDERHLREFSAFFGTYLTSSFDLRNDPEPILRNQYGGTCFCPICVRLVNGPHLQAKKLTTSDKRRAEALMVERLLQLASEHGLGLTNAEAEALISNPQTRMAAAYSAYGFWLIQRTKGFTDGSSILALWRQFAWNAGGSPRKDFELRYNDIDESERQLLALIKSGGNADQHEKEEEH